LRKAKEGSVIQYKELKIKMSTLNFINIYDDKKLFFNIKIKLIIKNKLYLVQISNVFKLVKSSINNNKFKSFFFRFGVEQSSTDRLKKSNLLKYT